jgi:hypothetical protein
VAGTTRTAGTLATDEYHACVPSNGTGGSSGMAALGSDDDRIMDLGDTGESI